MFCFVLFPTDVTIEERFLSEISNGSAQTQGESWRVIRMHVDNKLVWTKLVIMELHCVKTEKLQLWSQPQPSSNPSWVTFQLCYFELFVSILKLICNGAKDQLLSLAEKLQLTFWNIAVVQQKVKTTMRIRRSTAVLNAKAWICHLKQQMLLRKPQFGSLVCHLKSLLGHQKSPLALHENLLSRLCNYHQT